MNLTETNETPFDPLPPREGLPENPLSVWPDPAETRVTVKLSEPQTATILLLDAAGTALIRKRIYYRAEVELDIQSVPPGRYTVVAEYYGQTYSQKLTVMRE